MSVWSPEKHADDGRPAGQHAGSVNEPERAYRPNRVMAAGATAAKLAVGAMGSDRTQNAGSRTPRPLAGVSGLADSGARGS
jgi:hypothetical protein